MSSKLNFPDAVPELHGESVYLREPTEDDVPAWYERASDTESAALAGDPIPESIEVGFAWLRRNRNRFRQQAGIRWAIVPRGSTQSVGSIGLAIASNEERTAELGVVIGRAHWGQGIGTSAGHLVIRFAFDTLGLTEIRAELLQSNLASRRVLEKLGFRFERTLPDFEQSDAGPQDGHLYVLHRNDTATGQSAVAGTHE
jgi:ribosomal-protein-alanine N-acetyltransferase